MNGLFVLAVKRCMRRLWVGNNGGHVEGKQHVQRVKDRENLAQVASVFQDGSYSRIVNLIPYLPKLDTISPVVLSSSITTKKCRTKGTKQPLIYFCYAGLGTDADTE